jgi:hypothetical protein
MIMVMTIMLSQSTNTSLYTGRLEGRNKVRQNSQVQDSIVLSKVDTYNIGTELDES